MGRRGSFGRLGFWLAALLWLPAGIVATAVVRFGADAWPATEPGAWIAMAVMSLQSLVFVAPCGLPLALACRRLWRLGHGRVAWAAGIGLGTVTVAASLGAGLLGPAGILAFASVLSAPAWIAVWRLARRRRA